MAITRIEGNTGARDDQLYICARVLGEIWEGNFYNIQEFTVCLKERTSTKRPVKEAVKLNIPRTFVKNGVKYELGCGAMSEGHILTYTADAIVKKHKLQNKKYWAWLEVAA